MVPLIVLPFLYLFFYLFQDAFGQPDTKAVLMETPAINPVLPEPALSQGHFKDKFSSFLEAHKYDRTESAIREIDREPAIQPMKTVEQDTLESFPTSKIPNDELEYITPSGKVRGKPTKVKDIQAKEQDDDIEQHMKLFRAQMNYVDSLFKSEEGATNKEMVEGETVRDREQVQPVSVQHIERVQKASIRTIGKSGVHFNTIVRDQEPLLIRAMIDEELKVGPSGRIRIRLLEDVFVGDVMMEKGQYLYGLVTAFQPQRMEIHIHSVLLEGEIQPISLDVYDLDGMKGLYVPASQFRELTKDLGNSVTSGRQLQMDNLRDNKMGLLQDAGRDAFNTTTRAAAKSFRKNKARVKYGTMVYLVNSKQNK